MASPVVLQVVEHVVLFKARDGATQSATELWAATVRTLRELEGVLHLYVGAVLSCKPEACAWTHVLYGRYRDKAALQAYAAHPKHLQVVALGNTLFSDVMALDWEAHVKPPSSSSGTPSISASRIVFIQWKLDTSQEHISALTSGFSDSPQSTSGPNFSPARARGFQWGFAALHECEKDLQEDHSSHLHLLTQTSAIERFLLIDFAAMEGPTASI